MFVPGSAVAIEPPTDEEWDELDRAADVTQLFQSRPWVQAWLDHLAHEDEVPAVVSIRQGGVLRGLAPMVLTLGGPCGQLEQIRFAGTDLNDYNELHGAPDAAASVIESLLETLGVPVVLENVPLGSPLADVVSSPTSVWDVSTGSPVPCPTTGVLDQVPETPSRRAREWSRVLDRLAHPEALAIDLLDDPPAVEEFAPSFVQRRLDAWKVRGRHHMLLGAQRDAAFPGFLGQALRGLAERGRAFFVNLSHGGEVLASDLWLRDRSEALLYMRFFNPGAARVQPGLVLLWLTIRLLWDGGIRRVHFGRGNEPYKRLFGAGSEVVLTMICSRSPPLERRAHG